MKNGKIEIVCEEIKMILQDYHFIKEKLPETFNFGLFHMNIKRFKEQIIYNIENTYLTQLERCMITKNLLYDI